MLFYYVHLLSFLFVLVIMSMFICRCSFANVLLIIFYNLVLPMLLFWCSFVDDFLLSIIILLSFY